jgi:phage tail tape-measure protein
LVRLVAWKLSTSAFWALVPATLYATVTWPFAQTVVGDEEGAPVGEAVGDCVSPAAVGAEVGDVVGEALGCNVVGALVGVTVGEEVGASVGELLGL